MPSIIKYFVGNFIKKKYIILQNLKSICQKKVKIMHLFMAFTLIKHVSNVVEQTSSFTTIQQTLLYTALIIRKEKMKLVS